MLKTDAAGLAVALNALADTFDKKHVTEDATVVWFETLREFPNELVRGILRTWPKSHAKFPTPADVWKIVNDIQISERAQIAKNNQTQAREPVKFSRTDEGKRALAEIRKLVDQPKPSPIEHWHRVLSRFKPDTLSHDYATAALNVLQRKRRRQPGEDQEAA